MSQCGWGETVDARHNRVASRLRFIEKELKSFDRSPSERQNQKFGCLCTSYLLKRCCHSNSPGYSLVIPSERRIMPIAQTLTPSDITNPETFNPIHLSNDAVFATCSSLANCWAERGLNKGMRAAVDTSIVASESLDRLGKWYGKQILRIGCLPYDEQVKVLRRVCKKIVAKRLARAIEGAKCRKRQGLCTVVAIVTDEQVADKAPIPIEIAIKNELFVKIAAFLDSDTKQLFEMIRIGTSKVDIANTFAISVRSVERRTEKMIGKLRTCFGQR